MKPPRRRRRSGWTHHWSIPKLARSLSVRPRVIPLIDSATFLADLPEQLVHFPKTLEHFRAEPGQTPRLAGRWSRCWWRRYCPRLYSTLDPLVAVVILERRHAGNILPQGVGANKLPGGRPLLVIRRWMSHPPEAHIVDHDRTVWFEAFEADLDTEPRQWIKVESIGGQAIFLGTEYSKSILACQCAGEVQEDCI